MPPNTDTADEARAHLDAFVTVNLEAFVNAAKAYADHPADEQVRQVPVGTIEHLDRLVRLRNGLRRR